MNRITKKTETRLSRQATLWSWLSRGAVTIIAIAALMFATTGAHASCANLTGLASNGPIKLPMFAQAANDLGLPSSDTIVGLWHVEYTMLPPGGPPTLMNISLKEWHSDGTEFENAYLPPDGGNICFGVWKTVAPRTVHLHHLGWLFTPGSTPPTATGYFIQDETDILSRDGNSYTGTYKFQAYNMEGAPLGGEVNGTIAATRITVN
jgi:hypothetical protein